MVHGCAAKVVNAAMDMPTPSTSDVEFTPERGSVYDRSAAWVKSHRRASIAAATGLIVTIFAAILWFAWVDGNGHRSWSIAAARTATTLSPADVANLDRRLAGLKPGTPGFAQRADDHLKLLSTLKLIDGRAGLALDRHLIRFIAATRDEFSRGDGNVGYEIGEQVFGLIDSVRMRQQAAQRLALFTMQGKITGQARLERLFRSWALIDRSCRDSAAGCDGLTRDFALYFAAHARINTDAQQSAFLLARRIRNAQNRVQTYREIGSLLMRPTLGNPTDDALIAATTAGLKAKQGKTAVAAAAALPARSGKNRDAMLRMVMDRLLNDKNLPDGLDAGLAISDPALRDAALLRVVNLGSSEGYLHEAQIAQSKIENSDQRTMASMLIGVALAKPGYLTQAQHYLADAVSAVSAIKDGAVRQAAAAYGAHAMAEAGNLDDATALLKLARHNTPITDIALSSMADLYSRTRDAKGLSALASSAKGASAGELIGRAAATAFRAGDFALAERLVADAPDDNAWLHAAGRLALAGYTAKPWLANARSRFVRLPVNDPDLADSLAYADAAFAMAQGDYALSSRRLPLIANPSLRGEVARGLGVALVRKGDYNAATALQANFTSADTGNRDALKAGLAIELGKTGAIRAAAYTARDMNDVDTRVRTLRLIARLQADRLDHFSALKGQAQPLVPDAGREIRPVAEVERYIYATFGVKQQNLGDYLPRLPNSDNIEASTVRSALPYNDSSGFVDVVPLVNNDYNKKFLTARSVQDDWTLVGATIVMTAQSSRHPIYLHLSRGRIDIPQLWEELTLRGQGQYLLRNGRDYTLRAPLFVSDGATLTVSGSNVKALRMSTERASFIVNAGDMRIADVTLVGWTEGTNAPTPMTFETRNDFRPFYIAWSNSATRAVGSHFLNLGYAAGKAYGMTLTYGPVTLLQRNVEQIRPPTGTFVENSFEDMLYGFYSYEANDVQVVGNEYRNNIVYGIDPHDRSHKLLFSYNTVYGSHKKHGIIGSRNVEDSWYIGNLTFDNKGSGMMMDRYAGRNIMYANTAFDNHSNGISIYESPCNIIASNSVFNNGRSGITVRNSWDVGIFHNSIQDNRNLGIEGYAVEFVTKPGAPSRNLLLDPYERFLSAAAVSNRLKNNGQGGMGMTGMGAMLLQKNTLIGPSKRLFLNDLRLAERDIGSRQASGVMVAGGCPHPKRPYSCPFIQQNYLSRELAAAPLSGRPFPSCPGNTIVNAATKQGSVFAPDQSRDDDIEDRAAPSAPVSASKGRAL